MCVVLFLFVYCCAIPVVHISCWVFGVCWSVVCYVRKCTDVHWKIVSICYVFMCGGMWCFMC